MTPEQQKEVLGRSVLGALSVAAGCSLDRPEIDDGSIDFTIKSYDASAPLRTARIDIQLKSTSVPFVKGEFLHLSLKRKNYEDLISKSLNKQLLVVFVMPEEQESWVLASESECLIRHCAFWHCLTGESRTRNLRSVAVKVPRKNILTPEVIEAMIREIHYSLLD